MDYWNKDTLVLGCGNVLFGDDGFGPAVVEYLKKNWESPAQTGIINAGLGVRDILFNIILAEKKPQRIIIVDAVEVGNPPGEIFELKISEIPHKKTDDFSMHQQPTSNLLKELADICGVEVKIICAQVENIPEEVSPGLSKSVEKAIPGACQKIEKYLQ